MRELIAPADESRGFIDGIVWRGEVNASCHDSFVDRWTLKQTYDLAAIASPKPLELSRCDKATGVTASPAWLFDELGQVDPAAPPAERLEQLAAIMTKPENGWLSRTLVNRLWHRLLGRGLVHPVDSLRTRPWNEDLLDMLAGDLVSHGWDVKHVLETICTSEAYGVADQSPWASSDDAFAQRLVEGTATGPMPMVRAALVKGTALMAALGRPNRDQVVTSRPGDPR